MKCNLVKSLLILALAIVFVGCLTAPPPVQKLEGSDPSSQGAQSDGKPERKTEAAAVGDNELAQRLNEFLENGLQKLTQTL